MRAGWRPSDLSDTPTINIKFRKNGAHLSKSCGLPYIIAICDHPAAFWAWFDNGCDDNELCLFNFLRSKYESKIRNNQPVNFLYNLSSRVPLLDYTDFESRNMINMAINIIQSKPADSSEYKWRPKDYDGTSPAITLTLTNDQESGISYHQMIAIMESPDSFRYWMSFGNGNLHDEKFEFVKRSNDVAKTMRVNNPVEFQGKLAGKPKATCPADLRKMNLQQLLEKEFLPSNTNSSQATSTDQRWSTSDYQPPGEFMEITLTNGKVIKFYSPYLIAMCENPDEFNRWLQNGHLNLNNEFFYFVSRAKEIEILMKNNRPINVFGKVQEKTRVINNSEELKRLNLVALAESIFIKK